MNGSNNKEISIEIKVKRNTSWHVAIKSLGDGSVSFSYHIINAKLSNPFSLYGHLGTRTGWSRRFGHI